MWRRPNNPQHGFDCSGLVLRAAQIAGFNYFCKNTTTIGLELSECDNPLEEGDLILVKGHVMVITNLQNNTLIDAFSYSNSYGCVREIALSDAFEGLTTYDELYALAQGAKPLVFKNIEGQSTSSRQELKLLRLA